MILTPASLEAATTLSDSVQSKLALPGALDLPPLEEGLLPAEAGRRHLARGLAGWWMAMPHDEDVHAVLGALGVVDAGRGGDYRHRGRW